MQVLKQYDKRILQLLADAKHTGIVSSDLEWSKKVGITNTNLSAVKSGARSFTIEQIIKAAKLSKVSIDWITGLSPNRTLAKPVKTADLLKQAIIQIEKNNK